MTKRSRLFALGFAYLVAACFLATTVSAETVTVVGTVNDNFQIMQENGTTYEVVDTELGADVLSRTGTKVKVTGEITVEEDIKTIEVTSYTVLEE